MAKKDEKKRRERQAYDDSLLQLQIELNQLARWLQSTGKRLLVIFEGRDAAGKGGAIEAISSCLNPRSCRIVALSKPTERERTHWYFQRYVQHLPAAGEIVLFDRSWYNRAGVEKVFGFCTDVEHEQFLKDVPAFEAMLVNSGLLLRKYYLGCDQEKQEKRFQERINNPVKRWKISPIDLQSREKYDDYTAARAQMFEASHNKLAPWTMVDMNDQKSGRLSLISNLLDSIPDHHVNPEAIEFKPLKKAKLSKESTSLSVPFAKPFDLKKNARALKTGTSKQEASAIAKAKPAEVAKAKSKAPSQAKSKAAPQKPALAKPAPKQAVAKSVALKKSLPGGSAQLKSATKQVSSKPVGRSKR